MQSSRLIFSTTRVMGGAQPHNLTSRLGTRPLFGLVEALLKQVEGALGK